MNGWVDRWMDGWMEGRTIGEGTVGGGGVNKFISEVFYLLRNLIR